MDVPLSFLFTTRHDSNESLLYYDLKKPEITQVNEDDNLY